MLVQEYVHGVPLHVCSCATRASEARTCRFRVACVDRVPGARRPARRARDGRRDGRAARHRPSRRVAAERDGRRSTARRACSTSASRRRRWRAHVTREGTFKGKLAYSVARAARAARRRRQSDIYSLGVVLWELLVGHRMHGNAQGEAELIAEIMAGQLPIDHRGARAKSARGSARIAGASSRCIEPIVRKALDVNARRRWQTAADMEEAIARRGAARIGRRRRAVAARPSARTSSKSARR